ncbi:MAG: hypothetical protein EP343_33940 [Deltaproteobacteria bacterium]|nr:MAG: hypothetical protein EP343_33940 [Deltaproteobacteria bacterium]
MNDLVDEMTQAGVSIVGVGNGTPLMAQDFAESFGIRFALYTDPKRLTYQHFGMKRMLGLNLGTIRRGLASYRKGFRQGATKGDAFQQGGVVLVDSNGDLRWGHVDGGPGDHAELDAIRQAVQSVVGEFRP